MFALLQATQPDVCQAFCVAAEGLLGPQITNLVLSALAIGLVAWRTNKKVKKLADETESAKQEATSAKDEAKQAKRDLDVLRSSMLPQGNLIEIQGQLEGDAPQATKPGVFEGNFFPTGPYRAIVRQRPYDKPPPPAPKDEQRIDDDANTIPPKRGR